MFKNPNLLQNAYFSVFLGLPIIMGWGPTNVNHLFIQPDTPNKTHLRWNRPYKQYLEKLFYDVCSIGDPRDEKIAGCPFSEQSRVATARYSYATFTLNSQAPTTVYFFKSVPHQF